MTRVRADGVPIDPARYKSPTRTELENSKNFSGEEDQVWFRAA